MLDSVSHRSIRGIRQRGFDPSFPLSTLEQIYGAITYCLAHQEEPAQYLQRQDAEWSKCAGSLNSGVQQWSIGCGRWARSRASSSHRESLLGRLCVARVCSMVIVGARHQDGAVKAGSGCLRFRAMC